jgi:hypothetical protein
MDTKMDNFLASYIEILFASYYITFDFFLFKMRCLFLQNLLLLIQEIILKLQPKFLRKREAANLTGGRIKTSGFTNERLLKARRVFFFDNTTIIWMGSTQHKYELPQGWKVKGGIKVSQFDLKKTSICVSIVQAWYAGNLQRGVGVFLTEIETAEVHFNHIPFLRC